MLDKKPGSLLLEAASLPAPPPALQGPAQLSRLQRVSGETAPPLQIPVTDGKKRAE